MSDRASALQARLLATFRTEAQEHLQEIRGNLDALQAEREPVRARELLEALFRLMHTLKGAARTVGLTEFEATAHRCEALLSEMVARGTLPEDRVVRTLQDASDTLAGFVAGSVADKSLAASSPGPSATTRDASAGSVQPTIRVEIDRLDRLVTLAENLLAPKLASAEHVRCSREIVEDLSAVGTRLPAEVRGEVRSIEQRARHFAAALRADDKALRTTVDDLYKEMRRARMIPAGSILEGFPLMVRDLCRETGKEAAWELSGAALEVDRKVLDLVKDPLVHLVRNAIDHGIEPPDVRVAAGKPRRGRVAVSVAPAEGGRISIEVADDGCGFALDALRDAAVRARLVSAEEVAAMNDQDVAELAYGAGVSTSPVITTISGHGLGLAIVRERIERVEGTISTRSDVNKGSVIRLELPASIITYRGLLVRAAETCLLLPLDAVERTFTVPHQDIILAHERRILTEGDRALPFARLSAVLGLPPTATNVERRREPCVLIRSAGRRGIVLVDEVIGEQEVVVKDLRPPLRRVRNVLATGLLGSGELVLVLRPLDVIASIAKTPANQAVASQVSVPRVQRVLVVDDSITTRTMERNLFESAGYAVMVAADGIDAWNVLQTQEVDVVVSDVDMPRMNGFELTARIREHSKFAELPVVLVTALEAREDKERGIRVGANAYVLKSGFNQANLLEIVRRLV